MDTQRTNNMHLNNIYKSLSQSHSFSLMTCCYVCLCVTNFLMRVLRVPEAGRLFGWREEKL